MRATRTVVLITVVLLLGWAGAAWADMCFQDQFDNILVGKSFSYPAKGNCKLFNGYFKDATYAVAGNACATSDGVHITFNLLASNSFTIPLIYTFEVRRDGAASGSGSNCPLGGTGCAVIDVIKLPTCPSPRLFLG
jgi:hypothetical protein